ncbi:unnamed protein product [Orchesella dallaii]|uniref:Gustatory receptor n=1 Tax=Orchesella dallaii TaxID=48710 RepID=A0ABP1QPY8_9HEXA
MAITVVTPLEISSRKIMLASSNSDWETDNNNIHSNSYHSTQSFAAKRTRFPIPNHFYQYYLKIAYYLCIFPFKLIEDSQGSYQVQKWLPQGILCGVFHLNGYWFIASGLREFSTETIIQDNFVYFTLLQRVTNCCYTLSFFDCVFRRDSNFRSIVTDLNSGVQLLEHQLILKVKIAIFSIAFLYFILALFNTLWSIDHLENHLDPRLVLSEFCHYGRNLLFLQSQTHDDASNSNGTRIHSNVNSSSNFHWTDVVLTLIGFVVPFSRWLVVYFLDLLIIVTTLTLRIAVTHFVAKLHDSNFSYDDIMKEYKYLKGLSADINSAVGLTVLMYFTDSVLYFSVSFHSTFTAEGVLNKIVVPLFFLSMTGWMLLAADTCLKMSRFKIWVRDMTLPGPNVVEEQLKTIMLLDELNDFPVGIEANGLFMITYAFIGKVIYSWKK